MDDWLFHGREAELAKVWGCTNGSQILSCLILGGRGIGKTELPL